MKPDVSHQAVKVETLNVTPSPPSPTPELQTPTLQRTLPPLGTPAPETPPPFQTPPPFPKATPSPRVTPAPTPAATPRATPAPTPQQTPTPRATPKASPLPSPSGRTDEEIKKGLSEKYGLDLKDLENPPHGFKTWQEYQEYMVKLDKFNETSFSLPPPLGEQTPFPTPTPGEEPTSRATPTATPIPVPEFKEGNIGYNYITFDYDQRRFRIRWEEEDQEIAAQHHPQSEPAKSESFQLPWQETWKENREAMVRAVIEEYDKRKAKPE